MSKIDQRDKRRRQETAEDPRSPGDILTLKLVHAVEYCDKDDPGAKASLFTRRAFYVEMPVKDGETNNKFTVFILEGKHSITPNTTVVEGLSGLEDLVGQEFVGRVLKPGDTIGGEQQSGTFEKDFRQTNPGLHRLYTAYALEDLAIMKKAAKRLFDKSRWPATDVASRLWTAAQELMATDAAYHDAAALLFAKSDLTEYQKLLHPEAFETMEAVS